MAGFDPNYYFAQRNRLNALREARMNKEVELATASENKYSALSAESIAAAAANPVPVQNNDASWVNRLGLDSNSVSGEAVNLAASLASGTARVGSQLATLPSDAMSFLGAIPLEEADYQAYNKYLNGTATEDDLARLNSPRGLGYAKDKKNAPTAFQLIQNANEKRQVSRKITETMDLQNIVNQDKRQGLANDLGQDFDASWGQTKEGWDKLKRNGERLSGAADVVAGLGKLIFNAGEAAVTNPAAASEYILENAPQLGVGLLGKAGKVALTASNVGYGTELYQQGITNYQKAHGGEMPPEELRRSIAMDAAGAAVMEEASDLLMLGAGKARKALKPGVTQEGATAANTVNRRSFKDSLIGVGKATGTGILTEAPTEGVQTYLEGEATLKPASAKDIYTGAAIGGIAGAGLTGGMRAVTEMAGATPEHAEIRQRETKTIQEAAKQNDPSPFLDPDSSNYDPVKAAKVLYQHTTLENVTPETKAQNEAKINEIIGKLEDERDQHVGKTSEGAKEIQAEIAHYEQLLPRVDAETQKEIQTYLDGLKSDLAAQANVDKKAAKEATTKVEGINTQLDTLYKLRNHLAKQNVITADPKALLAEADTAISQADEATVTKAQSAAQRVLTLSMAAPEKFSSQALQALADNEANGLTTSQREFLKAFAQARATEGKLIAANQKSTGKVHDEVLEGDPALGQLGLRQYRAMINSALNTGNAREAEKALRLFQRFQIGHALKAKQYNAFYQEALQTKERIPVIAKEGQGYVRAQPDETTTQYVGPNSGRMISNINLEAKLLQQSKAAFKAAMAARFNPQNQTTVTPGTASVPATFNGALQASLDAVQTMDVPSIHQELLLKDGSTVQANPVGKEYFDGQGNLIDRNIVVAWKNLGRPSWNPPHWEGKWANRDGKTLTRIQSTQATPVDSTSTTVNSTAPSGASLKSTALNHSTVDSTVDTVAGATAASGQVRLGTPINVSWKSGKYTFNETRTYEHRADDGRVSRTTVDENGNKKKEWLIVQADGTEVWAERAGDKEDYVKATEQEAQQIAENDLPKQAVVTKESTNNPSESPEGTSSTEATVPVTEVKEKKVTDPRNRTDLVGAVMRATGNKGVHSSLAETLTGEKDVRKTGKAQSLFTKEGQLDLDDLATLLNTEEGYAFKDGNDLAAAIGAQVSERQYNPSQLMEQQAKAEHREYVSQANQLAAEHGVKGLRGKRTLAHIEADIAKLNEQRKAEEAFWEQNGKEFDSLVSELQQQYPNLSLDDVWAMAESLMAEDTKDTHAKETPSANEADRLAPQETLSHETPRSPGQQLADGATEGREGSPSSGEGQGNSEAGEVAPAGQLEVFSRESAPTADILTLSRKGQLFSTFLKQVLRRKGDTTDRPLVAVKDFLSQWVKNQVSAKAFLPENFGEPSKEQFRLVGVFKQLAPQWNEAFRDSLAFTKPGGEDYRYKDPILELIVTGEDGKPDLPENVKTAMSYAAVSWIIENATRPGNSDADINRILGRQEETEVLPLEREKLGQVLARKNTVENGLGKRAVEALGFKSLPDTPMNFLPNLEVTLGTHILELLEAKGLVSQVDIQAEEGNRAPQQFIKLTRSTDGVLAETAQEILAAAKGSKGILDTIFSVESGNILPTLTPVPFKQTKAKNGQAIPKELAEILNAHNHQKNFLKQDVYSAYFGLSLETQVRIASGEWVKDDTQAMLVDGIKARNQALEREVLNLKEFVDYVLKAGDPKSGGWKTPFYFQHDAWNQQRAGIKNNTVNPQTSKVVRHHVMRESWPTEVNTQNLEEFNHFKLRVLEAFGEKTNAELNSTTLERMTDLFIANKDKRTNQFGSEKDAKKFKAIDAAVDVLVNHLQEGGTFSEAEEGLLLDGNQAGGEKMLTFDGLVALAQLRFAQQQGKSVFTTTLMGEIDGTSNGPIMAHLLFGAMENPGELEAFLKKGGFYSIDDLVQDYNEWHSQPGHYDLYEGMTVAAGKALDQLKAGLPNEFAQMPWMAEILLGKYIAVQSFIGQLIEDGKVTSAGRNLSKGPISPLVFGSSKARAIESMAQAFVESVAKQLQKLPDTPEARATAITELNKLLWTKEKDQFLSPQMTKPGLIALQFSEKQKQLIMASFKETFGKAYRQAIDTELKVFLERRKQINRASELAFTLYNAAYESLRAEFIQDLIEKGQLSYFQTKDGKKKPRTDLSAKQQAQFMIKVKDLVPMMHTAFSKEEGNVKAGLPIFNLETQLSQDPLYSPEVHLAGGKIREPHAQQRVMEGPGVRMTSMPIHGFDSANSQRANPEGTRINLHDAQGTGLKDFTPMGQDMNRALYQNALKYSPIRELATSLKTTIEGVAGLLQRSQSDMTTSERNALLEALAQALDTFATKHEMPVSHVLVSAMSDIQHTAYVADYNKLSVQMRTGAVDQYASEGARYEPSDAERDQARQLRDELPVGVEESTFNKIDLITNMVTPKLETRAPKEVKTVSDLLINLKTAGEMGAKSLLRQLDTLLRGQEASATRNFNVLLLRQLGQKIPDGLTVKLATSEQAREKSGSLAWHDVGREIFISPNLTPKDFTEALLHEVTHAVTAQVIETELAKAQENPKYQSPALEIVQELQALLKTVQERLTQTNDTRFDRFIRGENALHELVAWGMVNEEFQAFLKDLPFQSKTLGNRLISGMKAFVESLVNLLFPNVAGKRKETVTTGMEALLSNVAGLMASASEGPVVPKTLSMAANPQTFTSTEIFTALGLSQGTNLNPAFQDHLKDLLTGIVKTLYGTVGTLGNNILFQSAPTVTQGWQEVKQAGHVPFASESLTAGFTFTDPEAFVADQVEATVRAALDGPTARTGTAYKELVRLYQETKTKLIETGFNQSHPHLFNFIFKVEMNQGSRSDYLSRFVAMGLAHQGFNQALSLVPERAMSSVKPGIVARLNTWLQNALNWLAGKTTHTQDGEAAKTKLTTLVNQLVASEAKRRDALMGDNASWMDPLENSVKAVSQTVKDKAATVAQSRFFQNAKSPFVKATGSIISLVATERTAQFMEVLRKARNQALKDKEGLGMGLIREIQGTTNANAWLHKALRITKRMEGDRKDTITATAKTVLNSFDQGGIYLTPAMKHGMAMLLRVDLQSLLGVYTLADIQKFLSVPQAVTKEIESLERQLQGMTQFSRDQRRFFINEAHGLGYYLATNESKTSQQLMNAKAIAHMDATPWQGKISVRDENRVKGLVDTLATLYGLQYLDPTLKQPIREVVRREFARGNQSGIEMMLSLSQALQLESLDKLFDGNETQMMKGYLPEIYNPHRDIQIASRIAGQELLARGYERIDAPLSLDPMDPDQTVRHLYWVPFGNKQDYLSGALSLKGERAKGSRAATDEVEDLAAWKVNQDDLRSMQQRKRGLQDLTQDPRQFNPKTVKNTFAVPVLNADGQVKEYRYLLHAKTRDEVLQRNNDFDQLLGALAGSILDKSTAPNQNRTLIEATKAQFDLDFGTDTESYVEISPESNNADYQAIYRMLPEKTKQAIREVWGETPLTVRVDHLDLLFGYRVPSAAALLKKGYQAENIAEKAFIQIATMIWHDKAELTLAKYEARWQEIVKEAKDILVIRSFSTLKNNVISNVSQLLLSGVPVKDLAKHHKDALAGVWEYKKDSEELAALEVQLKAGRIAGSRQAMEERIVQLRDSIARNPVLPLLEEGLMPAIVEDVAAESDRYSYKSELKTKFAGVGQWVPGPVKTLGKVVYMTRDTKAYQMLYYGTQVSDFLARYTLYQHLTTRKKNPLSHGEAIQKASEAFINYDIPTHRTIEYLNRMGFLLFTKYYIRIQKVIAELYKEKPGRAMAMLVTNHYFDQLPLLADSSMVSNPHNPFSTGAFKYFDALDDLATIKIGAALLK